MEKTKTKGITASDLKYIAILAMLIDHAAYLFVPAGSLLYMIMRFVGRITAPIMCFFISEGYHHTRNLKKYFGRMAIFAVISHFAYAFCFGGGFFARSQESMITTLFLCLLAVHVVNYEKIGMSLKIPLLLLIAYAADRCDWGHEAVVYALAFELARGSKKNQLTAYIGTAFVFKVLPLISTVLREPSYAAELWYNLGVFLPAAMLYFYNGERGGSKATKWVFYIFYPAHLLLLGFLEQKYG